MEETNNETLTMHLDKDLQDYEDYYESLNGLKEYFSNRTDCWYLEKTKEGNFAVEYFSSVEERKQFFKVHKDFETSSENLNDFIKNLGSRQECYETLKDSDK